LDAEFIEWPWPLRQTFCKSEKYRSQRFMKNGPARQKQQIVKKTSSFLNSAST
jgi:hypothetical protein